MGNRCTKNNLIHSFFDVAVTDRNVQIHCLFYNITNEEEQEEGHIFRKRQSRQRKHDKRADVFLDGFSRFLGVSVVVPLG